MRIRRRHQPQRPLWNDQQRAAALDQSIAFYEACGYAVEARTETYRCTMVRVPGLDHRKHLRWCAYSLGLWVIPYFLLWGYGDGSKHVISLEMDPYGNCRRSGRFKPAVVPVSPPRSERKNRNRETDPPLTHVGSGT